MSNLLETLGKRLIAEPFNEEVRVSYAEALQQAGQLEECIEQWDLLIKLQPKNVNYQECADNIRRSFDNTEQSENTIGTENQGHKIPVKIASIGNRIADRSNVVSIQRAGTVRFSDIAGMENTKKLVRRKIIEPFINPSLFAKFKKKAGGGVLLYGPPGCGKTMMAKAIATECKASFHAVGISDILNMYIGESESNLASIFDRARSETPSVLFFDELDALAYSRSKANSDYTRTLVNEFLNQLDGMNGNNEEMLILGATNMPWDVDDAMKRPGRFDRQIFVSPPDEAARAEMLRIKLQEVPCEEISTEKISRACHLFSGADIDGLIEQAKDYVLDDIMDANLERNLSEADLIKAAEELEPSTTDWLQTARNLVKFGNAGGSYKDVERFLRTIKMY